MKRQYIDVERIHELSQIDAGVTLEQKMMKLHEESGELAQEVLAFTGSPNASKSAKGTKESVLEEACDVINVVMDIVNAVVQTEDDEDFVVDIFSKKLDKWEGKTKQYKSKVAPKDTRGLLDIINTKILVNPNNRQAIKEKLENDYGYKVFGNNLTDEELHSYYIYSWDGENYNIQAEYMDMDDISNEYFNTHELKEVFFVDGEFLNKTN